MPAGSIEMTEKSLSREFVKCPSEQETGEQGNAALKEFSEKHINAVKNGVIDNQEHITELKAQVTELRDIAVDQQEQINDLKSLVDKLIMVYHAPSEDVFNTQKTHPTKRAPFYNGWLNMYCPGILTGQFHGGTAAQKYGLIIEEIANMRNKMIKKIETDLTEEHERIDREAVELVAKEKKDLEEKEKKKSRAEARSKVLDIVAEKKAKLKELEDEILLVNFASESEDSEDPEDLEEELERQESELRAQLAEARGKKEKSRGKSKKPQSSSSDPSTWSKEKAEKIGAMWCE